MQTYARPPHYLTETEFERLRLTDDQYAKMEQIITERRQGEMSKLRAMRQIEDDNDRFLRPILAAFIGNLIGAIVYMLLDDVFGGDLVSLYREPLSFLFWTGVASWQMRKK